MSTYKVITHDIPKAEDQKDEQISKLNAIIKDRDKTIANKDDLVTKKE